MTSNFTRVDRPAETRALWEILERTGCARLVLESARDTLLPVRVELAFADGVLRLDASAIREEPAVRAMRSGEGFRIVARGSNGVVRTPVLTVKGVREEDGHLYCECDLPACLEERQRRDSFRATLHMGMTARVDLYDGGTTAGGYLRDLSLHGCLAEMEPSAVVLLEEPCPSLHLAISFPDGTRFTAPTTPCHRSVERDRIVCGFSFEVTDPKQEQRLWYLVREIERESARNAASGKRELRPSPLFVGNSLDDLLETGANAYQFPPARRLARCAAYLTTQIVKLREGESLDATMLSQHVEQLLAMRDEDRDGLLFALACLHREPPLVLHGLAVATRWADMAPALGLQPSVCKALTAAGMVHDLGKALLPASLRAAIRLDEPRQRDFRRHVPLLKDRLPACPWLLPLAVQTVVDGANERLDGSGYPDHRNADDLSELTRLAAVIDVVDAMGRDRPDRPRQPIEQIYLHLRKSPHLFDQRWVERYIQHFGVWPTGTLVRFRSGEMGWILSLGQDGAPAAVRLVDAAAFPDTTGGTVVRDGGLSRLGEPVAAIPAN
ncbi:MAG: HD domain-containing phosphohydrolase [Rhodanobacteraceae bacterium]